MPRVYNIGLDHYIPLGAVYCGRGSWRGQQDSKYKNPFRMRNDSQEERDRVCNLFESEVLPKLDVSELRGKHLVCHCAPLRCHCDSILRKVNESDI